MLYPELPDDLTAHPDFPAEVGAALAERIRAREAASATSRASTAVLRATRAEAAEESRLLIREGTMPEPGAADERTARLALATREARSADRAREAADRRLAAAYGEHVAEIAALAHRVALDAHAEVERLGEDFLAALRTREAAYEAAGMPGREARELNRSGSTGWEFVYWASRPERHARVMTSDGLPKPDRAETLSRVSALVEGFPVEAVEASAAKVGR